MTRARRRPDDEDFRVKALPSERGGGRGLVLNQAMCACCSCCCCLHTLGGLIGAAVMSGGRYDPETRERGPSAAGLYWALLGLGAGALAVAGGFNDEWGLLGVILIFPAVQLGVSLLALIVILASGSERQGERLGSLGRITLGTILGAIVGGLLLAGLLG